MADRESLSLTGSLSGLVHWEPADECLPLQPVRTLWEAEGDMAPLGRAKATARHCADDRGGGRGGVLLFTLADGSELRASYSFAPLSQSPELLSLQMTGEFASGGTGRFVRASGPWKAVVHAHTTVVPPTLETVWPIDIAFDGTVTWERES